jgi:hypothetical protein
MDNDKRAALIVASVLMNLMSRSGLDGAWASIDAEVQAEIYESLGFAVLTLLEAE